MSSSSPHHHPDSSSSASSTQQDTHNDHEQHLSYAQVAAQHPSPDSPAASDLGTTPTAASSVPPPHLTTPPSQSRPTAPATAATASPAPTSSPTPNPHRRTHSSTSSGPPSAPISAVSSPARRDYTPGDLSDSVLHEESGEEDGYGHTGEENTGEFGRRGSEDLFGTASSHGGASLQRQSSTRAGAGSGLAPLAAQRPPLSRPPSTQPNRRSISVNTSASAASSSAPARAPSGVDGGVRRSLYHPSSQPGLSRAPSSSAPGGGGPGSRTIRRSASRGTAPSASGRGGAPSATASETEEDAFSDAGGQQGWPSLGGHGGGYHDDAHLAPYLAQQHGHPGPRGAASRERAFSPATARRRQVEREREEEEEGEWDRGEELVRQRMKERKEARRAARAAARQQKQAQQQRLSSYTAYSQTPGGLESDYSATGTATPNALGLGYGFPAAPSHAGTSRARDASTARSEAYSLWSDAPAGARSPTHPAGAPWSPLPLPPGGYAQQQQQQQLPRPGLGARGASYVSNASSFPGAGLVRSRAGSTAPSVIEGSEHGGADGAGEGEETDEFDAFSAAGPGEEDGDIVGRHEPRLEDWRDGGADGGHEGEDGESGSEGEDVEYTLKDRQDAINVEHPFGLPIWKPALYKKSRSIARHAESALHSAPSSTALHHLLPVNLLWTLLFGFALFLLCTLVASVLFVTPWGGAKYARVVWELGNYLVWPFGKYVEGWTDGGANDVDPHHDVEVADGEQGHHHVVEGSYRHDPEAGGRTFGRGRSGTISAAGSGSAGGTTRSRPTAAGVFEQDHGALPDEPLRRSDRTVRATPSASSLRPDEHSRLLAQQRAHRGYGSTATVVPDGSAGNGDKSYRSSGSEETILGVRPHDFSKDEDGTSHAFRVRALGRVVWWAAFYALIAPAMLLVCVACWFFVFTIPMAKLLWVLVRHLNNEPLSLHFRSPGEYAHVEQDLSTIVDEDEVVEDAVEHEEQQQQQQGSTLLHPHPHPHPHQHVHNEPASPLVYPLRAGQPAPPVSRQSLVADKRKGRLRGPHPTVLLCTYRAAGLEYYKYTVDGVNIWFINLMSLVFFAIADFFFLEPYVERHPESSALLKFLAGQAFVFTLSLLSVIPLSYFIGQAVASISAQSSIGVGAVINASFGSVIEIILYSIALTQSKGELVEGSIVGSILAGVLLMPGASMIGGAVRRKEQRFNAKSAGVTSTMLIMAVIGTLTPTMFYEIYGSFQLTCTGCEISPEGGLLDNAAERCRTCYYEHVSPADDPFYKSTVRLLSYYCAIILVLSYLIGLWFSLRTHASQIWQNAQPGAVEHGATRPLSGASQHHPPLHERRSLYQRIVPSQLFQPRRRPSNLHRTGETPLQTPLITPLTPHPPPLPSAPASHKHDSILPLDLPHGYSADEFNRVLAAAGGAVPRATSHAREVSVQQQQQQAAHKEEEGHGGHDAPNWSRAKSATVLMACTVLYAIIAEVLVDEVDTVLDGSGIPEKLLGVTLFALVPNTTEFMNAISFSLNGNIALSMEIGSAYALQVCLIQIPAMIAFSAWYGLGKETLAHRAFTLVFPRWDVIAILFSVFLITYVYIESRSNYQRGALLCLSYLVLIGGFAFAPADRDTEDNPGFTALASSILHPSTLPFYDRLRALVLAIFTR
ncbi:hypothetical protein JCM8097_006112 [Rhodosporidiobolus ruineniae]